MNLTSPLPTDMAELLTLIDAAIAARAQGSFDSSVPLNKFLPLVRFFTFFGYF